VWTDGQTDRQAPNTCNGKFLLLILVWGGISKIRQHIDGFIHFFLLFVVLFFLFQSPFSLFSLFLSMERTGALISTKREWLRRLQGLRNEETRLTSEIHRLCKHFEADEIHAISWDGEKEAVQQSHKVWTTWDGIKRDVESLKSFVERGAYGSLSKLQKLLNKVETQINEWKSTQRLAYEALQSEEKIVQKEVDHLQQRIEDVERSLLGSSSSGPLSSDAVGTRGISDGKAKRTALGGRDRDLAPEVVAYEEYIAKHGPTGGWDERDHALYLRRLTQYGPRREKECLERIQNDLAQYDAEEILSHHLWNEGLQSHDNARRRAIEAWRQQRQEEAVADMSDVISETSSVDEKQRTNRMRGSGGEGGDPSTHLEKMKKRAMIIEWKVHCFRVPFHLLFDAFIHSFLCWIGCLIVLILIVIVIPIVIRIACKHRLQKMLKRQKRKPVVVREKLPQRELNGNEEKPAKLNFKRSF
jgi:hypothetical protein